MLPPILKPTVVFWFDENGSYQTGSLRYVTLYLQILIFFMTSVYTLYITAKSEGKVRRRNLTIGLFGIAMLALIILQIEFPLWPCYTIGYMFGTSLLHSFVVEDEKSEYRKELERTLQREKNSAAREGAKAGACRKPHGKCSARANVSACR